MALALSVFLHHTTSYNIGMSAVLIFFVLSGYWVATMWAATYSKTRAPYLTFVVSRFWRIAPVFALCSVITWGLLYWRGEAPAVIGSHARQVFSNLFILGYNSLPFQANVPGWSLDMELQFYLVAPLVIFLLSKSIHVLAIFVLTTVLSQWLGGAATVAPFIIFFALGVASAIYGLKPSRALAYRSLLATLALLFIFAALFVKNIALGELQGRDLVALSSTSNLLVAVMMTPFALYTVRQKSGPVDRMLGDLTYIVYLLHWPVLGAIQTGEGSYGNRLWLCSEALVIILAVSFVVWRYFDHPLNQWRAAWVASRKLPASAAARFAG
ncbi:acyltransferase family protein [Methylocystis bryophila]|nr:acyltransferase [Methylocystis bryophila]